MSLKSWRTAKDLNQAETAKILGFTQPTISRIEDDEARASLSAALKILDLTGERIGPLTEKSKREIEVLRELAEGAAA